MKTIFTLIVILFFGLTSAKAQEDSLYIYYEGSVILQHAIAGIDSITFTPSTPPEPQKGVYDFDGNGYDTVHIGTQVWLAENFKCTHYSNGLPIPLLGDSASWVDATAGGYGIYTYDDSSTIADYGLYYNWYAGTDPNGLAPVGWHVPTLQDWQTLKAFVDSAYGSPEAGGQALKEPGTDHWNTDLGATNATGFNALPAGFFRKAWVAQTAWAAFQVTDDFNTDDNSLINIFGFHVYNDGHLLHAGPYAKTDGYSIRLIMDSPPVK